MAVRIVIADDADLLLLGAETVLGQDHRCRVVGLARCLDDLLPLVQEQAPDVVLLGEWLYSIDTLSAVQRLLVLRPDLRIIVMGSLADGLLIHELFAQGAAGYLYKSDDLLECLPHAVNTVMCDRPYLSPTANAEYLVAMQHPADIVTLDEELRQVLQRLARGEHVGEIAHGMGISLRRVYWVRQKLRQRFGAKTNEHLIHRAAVEGFLYPYE
jgi:DNA-binding NarL/FixJ family response regulator